MPRIDAPTSQWTTRLLKSNVVLLTDFGLELLPDGRYTLSTNSRDAIFKEIVGRPGKYGIETDTTLTEDMFFTQIGTGKIKGYE